MWSFAAFFLWMILSMQIWPPQPVEAPDSATTTQTADAGTAAAVQPGDQSTPAGVQPAAIEEPVAGFVGEVR